VSNVNIVLILFWLRWGYTIGEIAVPSDRFHWLWTEKGAHRNCLSPTRDPWTTITSRVLLFVYVMNINIPGQLEDLWVI